MSQPQNNSSRQPHHKNHHNVTSITTTTTTIMTQRSFIFPLALAGSFIALVFLLSHHIEEPFWLLKEPQRLASSRDPSPTEDTRVPSRRSRRALDGEALWNTKSLYTASRVALEEVEPGDENGTKVKAPEAPHDEEIVVLSSTITQDDNAKQQELEALAQKLLQPQSFDTNSTSLTPHQFIHLHTMKTGGTSIDHMMQCAMERLKEQTSLQVPYYSLHECKRSYYKDCLVGNTPYCTTKMETSAILSFCAPLHDLPKFGWNASSYAAITVLRHPVDRVWSFFRFAPKGCFKCRNLTDVYRAIDAGVGDTSVYNVSEYDALCLKSLQNHETRNLQWQGPGDEETMTEEELVAQAIFSMKKFFTVVGLTSHLTETHAMIGQVFPWLNVTVAGSDKACPLPKDNSTPKNNHCMPDNSHWKLPDRPDDETRKMIEEHNALDMKLYEAAVEHFELQRRALAMGETSS
jgi:hypothetical protein